MVERVPVPEGLEGMPPGAALAALLDSVDLSRVNGFDAVRLVQATARQVAHDQARLLAGVATVSRCPPCTPDDERVARAEPDGDVLQATVDEVGWALHLTTVAAGRLVTAAEGAVTDHPGLHTALSDGRLDLPRVQVIIDAIGVLGRPAATEVVAKILPQAPELTTGQLRAELAKLVLAVDPVAAAKRRARAVADRRVARYVDGDGTATITALGLPTERAAAAMHRLDSLARGARTGGDARTLDQLRADIMVGLLDGTAQPTTTGGRATGSPWQVVGDDGELLGVVPARHRFPTAAQLRHLRARDKTCRAPGCRVPAHRADIDHTIDHAAGGDTVVDNLCPLCRRHHTAKHTRGFGLAQPLPGVFLWTTPRGHTYQRWEEPDTDPPH